MQPSWLNLLDNIQAKERQADYTQVRNGTTNMEPQLWFDYWLGFNQPVFLYIMKPISGFDQRHSHLPIVLRLSERQRDCIVEVAVCAMDVIQILTHPPLPFSYYQIIHWHVLGSHASSSQSSLVHHHSSLNCIICFLCHTFSNFKSDLIIILLSILGISLLFMNSSNIVSPSIVIFTFIQATNHSHIDNSGVSLLSYFYFFWNICNT